MTRKQRRLTLIGTAGAVLALAAGLVAYALTDRIVFFNAPSDVIARPVPPDQRIRLGGLVKEGSVERGTGTTVRFAITDTAATIPVTFTGILPDLFREGQGVVAEGRLEHGVFLADQVLAKHDEKYMPPEAAESLKRSGYWQHMQDQIKGSKTGSAPATGSGGQ